MERDFICRHHVEPRVQLYVPKEETSKIPLKYTDVTRTTHTKLDVLQESRTEVNWNVDVDRSLSDSWTRFTKFTFFSKKCGPGEQLANSQATTRPDCLWPGMWSGTSGLSRNRSSTMVGNCEAFVLSVQMMESSRNPSKTNGRPMEAAMPCKLRTTERPNKLLGGETAKPKDPTKSPPTKKACMHRGTW